MAKFWGRRKEEQREQQDTRLAGANGFGAPFHIVFSFHPLPEAGAMSYSYDTLCLPKYSPIGNGPGVRADFLSPPGPLQPLQGTNLSAIGAPGVMTGGFYAQPLVDITSSPGAEYYGGAGPRGMGDVDPAYAGITLAPGSYQLPG